MPRDEVMTMTTSQDHGLIEGLETENRRLRRELLMARVDLQEPRSVQLDPMAVARQTVVDKAETFWAMGIEEPPGRNYAAIDDFIRGDKGLSWPSADLERPNRPYTKNGQFAWCGAFAATCWGHAGLLLEIRKRVMPSTYRINRWLKEHPDRRIAVEDVIASDVVVVGPWEHPYGAHITVAVGPPSHERDGLAIPTDEDGLAIPTIEGNARGLGVNSRRYEGVIRHRRPLRPTQTRPGDKTYVALYAVRFLPSDIGLRVSM